MNDLSELIDAVTIVDEPPLLPTARVRTYFLQEKGDHISRRFRQNEYTCREERIEMVARGLWQLKFECTIGTSGIEETQDMQAQCSK